MRPKQLHEVREDREECEAVISLQEALVEQRPVHGHTALGRNEGNSVRESEKKDAIARGLMSDPEKAINLSDAITLVGTCQDMCPESERITRAFQNNVWDEEKDGKGQIVEGRMVKVFKRSDAGAAAQLPSDLRPPSVLKKTCDYLFDDLLANASAPGDVHGFIWDRARAIRNDFSIQQVTKIEDMRIAIDCFERIARFHIASLHEFAEVEKPYDGYVAQQEREQLDRTLLSLMQYYDDSRGRLELPNEPEFRAYCVVFQSQDPTPDLEDRLQSWPKEVSGDPRVRTAVEIYMAAQGTKLAQGPMEPRQPHVIARQHWEHFWALLRSRRVSYLLGCVAEVYFNLVREMALSAIVLTARPPKRQDAQWAPNAEWLIDELMVAFGFDDEEDVEWFCQQWGLKFQQKDGKSYLDLRELSHKALPTRARSDFPDQLKSQLVEEKRHGRTISAVIRGLDVREAEQAGMILEEYEDGLEGGNGEEPVEVAEQETVGGNGEGGVGNDKDKDEDEDEDEDSLFIPETKVPVKSSSSSAFPGLSAPTFAPFGTTGQSAGFPGASAPPLSAFGQPSAFNSSQPSASSFGKPSTTSLFPRASPTTLDTSSATTPAAATSPFIFGAPSSQQFSAFAQPSSAFTADRATSSSTAADAITSGKKVGPFTEEPLSSPPSASGLFPSTTDAAQPSLYTPKGDAPAKPGIAPSAPSLDAPTPNSKSTPQLQLHSNANANANGNGNASTPLSQSNQNAAISDNGAPNTGRRTSSSVANKPKHPSPLSQSFSADYDNAGAAAQQAKDIVADGTQRHPLQDSPVNIPKPPSTQNRTPPPPLEPPPVTDFDGLLTKLAREVTLAPIGGILEQFVRFRVRQLVEETHEKCRREQAAEYLKGLRQRVLIWKWGRKLRDQYLLSRYRRKRSETRQRAQRRLRASQGVDILRGRQNGISPLSSTTRTQESMAEHMHASAQATAGSKRPATHAQSASSPARESEAKRQRDLSHVNSRGAVSKPMPTRDPLNRSSFLGFSLAKLTRGGPAGPSHNTTRTTYFREKALGIKRPNLDPDTADWERRVAKRARSSSDGADMARSSSPALSTSRLRQDGGSMPPPAPRPGGSPSDADSGALFARLRAARESLKENGSFMESELSKHDELRNSMGDSGSSNESPSLARAREEARLRASLGLSNHAGTNDNRSGPAYRSRQSKFLSAGEQAEAVARARALRSSRAVSRETSRSASRADATDFSVADNADGKDLSVKQPPNRSILDGLAPSTSNGVSFAAPANGVATSSSGRLASQTPEAALQAAPHNTATQPPSRNPFAQSSSFAPAPPTMNPFLQAPAPIAFPFGSNTHEVQSTCPRDNTIARSQVNNALSETFGAQQPVKQDQDEETTAPQPQQSNSYTPMRDASQAISLLSDDAEEDGVAFGQEQFFGNALDVYGNANGSFESEDYANTFAAADGEGVESDENGEEIAYDDEEEEIVYDSEEEEIAYDDEEEEVEEDEGDGGAVDGGLVQMQPDSYQYSDAEGDEEDAQDDDDDDEQYRFEGLANRRNGHHSGEEGDEDADGEDDGYDEEDEEEAVDWDEEDEDEDDDEGANDSFANMAYNRRHAPQFPKTSALDGAGASAQEAIELSD
ncbi:Hypothetical predicted protein [Lecanosticta acicola]|uniref:SAC3/GANP/THP3 conserved domain-containing protein n=1 Tax=Lecanosticta acicola TaxID=111012 RepID=A0AAI8YSZ7_9PEZI|nr:Hypothetical predicted protein [Lecanosticta acicola]